MENLFTSPLSVNRIDRGFVLGTWLFQFSNTRFLTDPLKQTTITLYGLKEGSEVRVYDFWGNEIAGIESLTGTDEWSFSANYYGDGSPYNMIMVVVFHLYYNEVRFQYEVPFVDSKIPIFQVKDRWYKNP